MKLPTIDGTPIVYTHKLKKDEFQYCRQFLFVGTGTDLLDLAEALDTFDEKFLKKVGISPL
jgi:hypothetical protein